MWKRSTQESSDDDSGESRQTSEAGDNEAPGDATDEEEDGEDEPPNEQSDAASDEPPSLADDSDQGDDDGSDHESLPGLEDPVCYRTWPPPCCLRVVNNKAFCTMCRIDSA